MRVLLDSNAYSQLMLGREQVSRIVRDAEEVLLPAVVLGKLPRISARLEPPPIAESPCTIPSSSRSSPTAEWSRF